MPSMSAVVRCEFVFGNKFAGDHLALDLLLAVLTAEMCGW